MTIKYLAANEIQGLSSDTKPASVPTNSIFFETDTQSQYYFNGSSWVLITSGGGTSSSGVNFGSYTIYIDTNGAVKARNNFTNSIQYTTASAPATSADTSTLFNNVYGQLPITGGLVQLKRGLYSINAQNTVGDNTHLNTNIVTRGEGKYNTIIQTDPTITANVVDTFRIQCNASIENLKMEGNGVGHEAVRCQSAVTFNVDHCAIQNFTNIQIWSGSGAIGQTVRNTYFGPAADDQCALGVNEYAIIRNNVFDRRVAGMGSYGSLAGSCLTSGGAQNLICQGNVFHRAGTTPDGGPMSVSIEAFGTDYWNLLFDGNSFDGYGRLQIGEGGPWSGSNSPCNYRNIVVSNNTLRNHTLAVSGSDTLDPAGGHLKDIVVRGNTLYKSPWGGIMITHCAGPVIVSGNIIHDTNYATSTGEDRGGIYVVASLNVDVLGNTVYMTDTTTNVSPYGLGYDNVTNCRFYDNHIINTNTKTAVNAMTFAGANTNVLTRNNDINT